MFVCFQSKQHESWTYANLLPGFGVGSDHKETTENLNRSPQQLQKKQSH